MKGLKIYIGVMTLLLAISLGFGVYVWFMVQTLGDREAMVPTVIEPTVPPPIQ
jgi:hypothetical protein